MTNMIMSGDQGAIASKRAFGNIIAGMSAQAFGLATLLTAAAGAALASGAFFGWSAPGLFAGAGIAVAAGVGLAAVAAGMGADPVGGKATPKAGAAGGRAAGTSGVGNFGSRNAGPTRSDQPTQITVYVGGDRIHDSVVATARSREGSTSRPRVQVRSG